MNKETNDKIKMVTLDRGDRDLLRNSGLLFLRELCARSLLEKSSREIKKVAKSIQNKNIDLFFARSFYESLFNYQR